jgi:hypothetical protein
MGKERLGEEGEAFLFFSKRIRECLLLLLFGYFMVLFLSFLVSFATDFDGARFRTGCSWVVNAACS